MRRIMGSSAWSRGVSPCCQWRCEMCGVKARAPVPCLAASTYCVLCDNVSPLRDQHLHHLDMVVLHGMVKWRAPLKFTYAHTPTADQRTGGKQTATRGGGCPQHHNTAPARPGCSRPRFPAHPASSWCPRQQLHHEPGHLAWQLLQRKQQTLSRATSDASHPAM